MAIASLLAVLAAACHHDSDEPAPVEPVWSPSQPLNAGPALTDLALDASGRPSLQWWQPDPLPYQIVRASFADGRWDMARYGLSEIPAMSTARVSTAGAWTVISWAHIVGGPAGSQLLVQVNGPGSAAQTTTVSEQASVEATSSKPQATVSADGSVTAAWSTRTIDYGPANGPLLIRHWDRARGWGAITEIEPASSERSYWVEALHARADGTVLVFYYHYNHEVRQPADGSTWTLWVRPIDASGQPGTAVRLDDAALGPVGLNMGRAGEVGIYTVERDGAVVAVWPQGLNYVYCSVSRTLRGGAWSDAVRVDPGAADCAQDSVRALAGPDGRYALAWRSSSGEVISAELSASGRWGAPQRLADGSAGPFDAAICRDGSYGVVRSDAHAVWMQIRNASGAPGDRIELASSADATPADARIGVDASCNWTALWATYVSSDHGDSIFARRLLAGSLQPTATLVQSAALSTDFYVSNDPTVPPVRRYSGKLMLAVEPAGPALAVWQDAHFQLGWLRLQ